MIDTHAHLNFPDYKDDFTEVLSEAVSTGINKIINIGCDLSSSESSVKLADNNPGIYATIGFHPHEAKHYSDTAEARLKELANNFKVVAIGEIGLDFYRDHSPHDIQRTVFLRQLDLAKSLALPIVIHIRNAYQEAIDILADANVAETGVVLHCFSGSRQEAFRALDLGFYLSFGGVLTFKNSNLPELLNDIPLDSILLETDSPFLTPHPFRGKRNHPALIKFVYEKLAEIKSLSFTELETAIDNNAQQFFGFE